MSLRRASSSAIVGLTTATALVGCPKPPVAVVDADISGRIEIAGASDPKFLHYEDTMKDAPSVAPQRVGFPEKVAEIPGLRVTAHVTSEEMRIVVEATRSAGLVLDPAHARMAATREAAGVPLACTAASAQAAAGRASAALPAERFLLAEAGSRWMYRCGGRRFEQLYPGGHVFGMSSGTRSARADLAATGVGKQFVMTLPIVLEDDHATLVVEIKAEELRLRHVEPK
jgi:hypothetical protein